MGRGSSGAGGGAGGGSVKKAGGGLNSKQLAEELVKATNETEDRFDLVPKVVDLLKQAETGATMTFKNVKHTDEFGWSSTYSYKIVKRDDGRFDVRTNTGKNADVDSIPAIIQSVALTGGELTNVLWDRAGKE